MSTKEDKGKLYEGDNLVADDLDRFSHTTKRAQGGHASYTGSFHTQKEHSFDVGGPYLLRLSDGREAEVLIERIHRGIVSFTALGPFLRKSKT